MDIDKEGLSYFEEESHDFVIINHVLEHLFDPIYAVRECFRVLKKKGRLIIAVPDMRYTFDKHRPLTTTKDIYQRIKRYPKKPNKDDYVDILKFIHPSLLDKSEAKQNNALQSFLDRREHINIWTDDSFLEFFDEICTTFNINLKQETLFRSKENKFELAGCWIKA